MQHYLFVHFKEKTTPDGEQIYFGISKNGFEWETVNNSSPVLWCDKGEKGARDFAIIRSRKNGKFYILATDLCLARNMAEKYHNSWDEVLQNGSSYLSMWESDDLINWSEQKLITIGSQRFGCMWAPDIIYDKAEDNYVVHWSSGYEKNGIWQKGIFWSRTDDFLEYTEPQPLFCKDNQNYIDSAIYEDKDQYYMFLKSENPGETVQMYVSDKITGGYRRITEFDRNIQMEETGVLEGPTAVRTEDGGWCLFLDYYGRKESIQGYIPFYSADLQAGTFLRMEEKFSFPYRYKHGSILPITEGEYLRIQNFFCNNADKSTVEIE